METVNKFRFDSILKSRTLDDRTNDAVAVHLIAKDCSESEFILYLISLTIYFGYVKIYRRVTYETGFQPE